MECKNHPAVPAVSRCAGCKEPFCSDCLVEIAGTQYCGSCKIMAIQGPIAVEEAMKPCEEAGTALTLAIIGVFCFGIILGPIAISKALKAKKQIENNPQLTGSGKATAAIVIASAAIFLWIVSILARFSS